MIGKGDDHVKNTAVTGSSSKGPEYKPCDVGFYKVTAKGMALDLTIKEYSRLEISE